MMRADGVLGQDQRAVDGAPDRERPIADEVGAAVGAQLFIRRRDDGNVRGGGSQEIAELVDKFGAIVQAAIPGNDGAGRRNMWLLFATGFLGGVEGTIEDLYAAL